MSLRTSQLETLAFVATLPDGAIASDIAHHFGRSIRASEQRLERLVKSGHLGIKIACLPGVALAMYVLTDHGSTELQMADGVFV